MVNNRQGLETDAPVLIARVCRIPEESTSGCPLTGSFEQELLSSTCCDIATPQTAIELWQQTLSRLFRAHHSHGCKWKVVAKHIEVEARRTIGQA